VYFVTLSFHGDIYQVCLSHYSFPQQVPFARSSLNHEDIFILDTESKIFQFNGSSSSIQERAKALEVVQYLKDTNHEGKCDVAAVGKFAFEKML
jgi:gelsolin